MLVEQLKPASDMDSLDFYRAPSCAPSPYMFHFRPVTATLRARSRASLRDQRGQIYDKDAALKRELLDDEKGLTEHKTLIDLARNDIGRVSKPKSVAAKIHAHRALRERDTYRLGRLRRESGRSGRL